MEDWRSYDAIAGAYDRTWAPRFEMVARHLLALTPPAEGARLIDLGTGTGALCGALGEKLQTLRQVVGCDLSFAMLTQARRRVAALHPIVADATQLPFRSGSFDLATANCVLSHFEDYRRALREIVRVLTRPSAFAAACWGPVSDDLSATWKELLDGVAGEGTAQRAADAVAPWENYFSSTDNLRPALLEAGFSTVRMEVLQLSIDQSVEEYVADRELNSGARFARKLLGEVEWQRFAEQARGELQRRFGIRVRFERPVVLAVATLD
jgi:ubiquinone/menaquinone biosynthesis C-methylase UbiE